MDGHRRPQTDVKLVVLLVLVVVAALGFDPRHATSVASPGNKKARPCLGDFRGSLASGGQKHKNRTPNFGRFLAKLGPETSLDRQGSACSAGCT